MLFLGIDVGSSSVKVSLFDGQSGKTIAAGQYPAVEMPIHSPAPGFAEQDPDFWWECVQKACEAIFADSKFNASDVKSIGITYQMHGLVCVDANQNVLRPAIIWCDSRAVSLGNEALEALGGAHCFDELLNSPGNFTAAKLRWVQVNEPETFQKIHKIMLPGDYIAMRLSGELTTTATGLSEGILWNHAKSSVDTSLLAHWDINPALIPEVTPAIGEQTVTNQSALDALGISVGTPISYRCGDQPNNAFSLNVLEAGEVAATAGTSGVIYGVTDQASGDKQQRVNTFQHVTHTDDNARYGILACVNGAGRSLSWLRATLAEVGVSPDYPTLNKLADAVAIGSEGVHVLPFGNGAERIFGNQNLGGHIRNLDFNRHGLGHIVRATQEGVVFALKAGFDVMAELGLACQLIRVPNSSLFLSPIFKDAFCNAMGCQVDTIDTDSAEGAARGAALGSGFYKNREETFASLRIAHSLMPDQAKIDQYQSAYQRWQAELR